MGLERRTLVERMIDVLPLPYAVNCAIWALLLGPVFYLITMLFSGQDNVLVAMITAGGRIEQWQGIIYNIVGPCLLFYLPMSIRFMRTRISKAEPKIIPLLHGGKTDYQDTLGHILNYRRQIIFMVIFLVPGIPVIFLYQSDSLVAYVCWVILTCYTIVMLGSMSCLYLGSIIGLYRLGTKPLKWQSFLQDPLLGTKPVGTLSLSLAFSYFIGLGILILLSTFSPYDALKGTVFMSLYVVLILVGVFMFFFPTYRIHLKMVEEKARQSTLIHSHFAEDSLGLKAPLSNDPLANIQKLLSLEIADRKLQRVSTWPFDTSLLGKLTVIVLSVVATLVARVIIVALQL